MYVKNVKDTPQIWHCLSPVQAILPLHNFPYCAKRLKNENHKTREAKQKARTPVSSQSVYCWAVVSCVRCALIYLNFLFPEAVKSAQATTLAIMKPSLSHAGWELCQWTKRQLCAVLPPGISPLWWWHSWNLIPNAETLPVKPTEGSPGTLSKGGNSTHYDYGGSFGSSCRFQILFCYRDSARVLYPFTLWLTEKEDILHPPSKKMVRDTEDKGPGDKTGRTNYLQSA